MQTSTSLLMQPKAARLALCAVVFLATTGCPGPHRSTVVLFNNSGQAITIRDCQDAQIQIPADRYAELTDEYAPFGQGTRQWQCFRSRDFVVAAANGDRWVYRLNFQRTVERLLMSPRPSVRAEARMAWGAIPPHPTLRTYTSYSPPHSFVPISIAASGQILAGRWRISETHAAAETTGVQARYSGGEILYGTTNGLNENQVIARATPEFSADAQPAGFPIIPIARGSRQ
jgi:hypothetical protein